MAITKEKTKELLKKAWGGTKKGYQETSKFVGTYGPKFNRYTGQVASNIQRGIYVQPQKRIDVEFVQKRQINKKMPIKRRNNVDWNNLGVRF